MFTYHPSCVVSLSFDTTNRCIMFYSNILHPLNIGYVIDMAVLINR